MDVLIANLPAIINLLIAMIQAAPSLAAAAQNLVTTMKAEFNNTPLTDEQKAAIDAQFDLVDAALAKACADRLALGDQEVVDTLKS